MGTTHSESIRTQDAGGVGMPRWSPEDIWRPAPLGLVGLASLLVWNFSGYCPAHQRARRDHSPQQDPC